MRRLGRFLVSAPGGPARRYVVDHLFPPHGRRERWLRPLPGSLVRPAAGDGCGLAEAAAVLDRLPGSPPGEWILAGPRAEDRRERFTAFLFPPAPAGGAGAAPDRVVKLRRGRGASSETGAGLAAEGEALGALARELPEPLRRTLPAVLGHGMIEYGGEGWEFLVLSVLPGRSAYVELQADLFPARRAPGHLRAAGDWLARFHRATLRRAAAWSPPEWAPIAPDGEPEPPQWYRRLRSELDEAPWPLAAGHGDFWARNVLFGEPGDGSLPAPSLPGGDRLAGVVDWEHFRPEAPPFEDLFHFAWSYGAAFPWRGRRRSPEEAFRRTFLAETAVSREVRRYLAAYAREAGLDAGALGNLFRLFLLTRAASRRAPPSRPRQSSGSHPVPQPRPRQSSASHPDPPPRPRQSSAASGVGGGREATSQERIDWLTLYRMLEGAERSVFSG